MKELTPRQKKSQDMRKNVYDIFCRLSVEYEGNVTVKDICQEAGISVGSFYNFFESKEAVTASVYQYLNEEMDSFEYPEEPVERIMCIVERLMTLSMQKGVYFLRMAAIYEASHTPTIARSDYSGQIMQSSAAALLVSALDEGAAQGIFALEKPSWYYSDLIIFMHRSLLYFWMVNSGHFDALSTQLSYTKSILEKIKA